MKNKRRKDRICKGKLVKKINNGTVYSLGFIGAAIYFLTSATSLGMGFLGLLKALIWPAFIVLELFRFLMATY